MAVATWEGFLFINLAEDPEPFEQAFEPLLGRFSRFNLPNLKVHRTIEYDVHGNWKLLFQNYSECYHCGPVHPALAKLTPPTSGENDLTEGPFTGGFMVINRGHREHDHEREVVRRRGRAICRRRTWIASTTTRSSPTCSSACTPTT